MSLERVKFLENLLAEGLQLYWKWNPLKVFTQDFAKIKSHLLI